MKPTIQMIVAIVANKPSFSDRRKPNLTIPNNNDKAPNPAKEPEVFASSLAFSNLEVAIACDVSVLTCFTVIRSPITNIVAKNKNTAEKIKYDATFSAIFSSLDDIIFIAALNENPVNKVKIRETCPNQNTELFEIV